MDRKLRQVVPLLAVALLIAWPWQVRAGSDTSGSVRGAVVSEDGAGIPGATVTLEADQLVRGLVTRRTDEAGAFRFQDLPPGSYRLETVAEGFAARSYLLDIRLGRTSEVEVVLPVASVDESLDVIEEIPLREASSPALAVNYPRRILENLPVPRQFIEVVDLAPAINDRGAYGAGGLVEVGSVAKYSRGSYANTYRLNGIEVSNLSAGGTWVDPSFETIEEVQVIGVGAPAEYGDFTGTTVNLITRGGTNRFRGGASAYYLDDDLQSDNSGGQAELEPNTIDRDQEVTAWLGGPLVADRLLFFASAGQKRLSEAVAGSDFYNDLDHRQAYLRLDGSLSDSQELNGLYSTAPTDDSSLGLAVGSPPETGYDEELDVETWNVGWTGIWGSDLLVEAGYAGYRGNFAQVPVAGLDLPGIRDRRDGTSRNSFAYFRGEDNERNSLRANASWFLGSGGWIDHSVKGGVEVEETTTLNFNVQTGGVTYTIRPTAEGSVISAFTGFEWNDDLEIDGWSAFLQDELRIGERLSLNLGLRYDAPSFTDRSIDREVFALDLISPRLGVRYDLTGEGRALLRASAGRYYEKLFNGQKFNVLGSRDTETYYRYEVPAGADPLDPDVLAEAIQPENISFTFDRSTIPVDPDIDNPLSDVFNLGVDFEVARGALVSFDYIYKEDSNWFVVEDRAEHVWEPFLYVDPATGLEVPLFEQVDTNPADPWLTNDDFFERRHHLAIVSLNSRPTDRSTLSASVTYQRSTGTVGNDSDALWEGFYTSPGNPNIRNDRLDGPVDFDRTWQIKVLGSHVLPWNVLVAADLRYLSGRPYQATLDSQSIPGYSSQAWYPIFLESRGSRRFDDSTLLNLRLARPFVLPGSSEIEVILNVRNVLDDDAPVRVAENPYSTYVSGDPAFGQAQEIIAPRRYEFGLRFAF